MKLEKSESRKMKAKALWWLRCEKRCAFIATEGGGYNSDALGINEKVMIEIEIKTTEIDLRNDWKKSKHRQYFTPKEDAIDLTSNNRWVPNFFYFMVPPELIDFAIKSIEKNNAPYGVINSETMLISHRAKKIHDRIPCAEVKFITALRMGSELIRFHEAWI